MEQLARDVTGWAAHAVEFFHLLGDTQYMNHIRLHNHYAPDARHWKTGLYIDSGFDRTAHKVDVRRIAPEGPLQHPEHRHLSLVAQRLQRLQCARPRLRPIPMFPLQLAGPGYSALQQSHVAGRRHYGARAPINVPDRLRRRVLCEDLQQRARPFITAKGTAWRSTIDGKSAEPLRNRGLRTSPVTASWVNMPAAAVPFAAAVDPELGRIALPPSAGDASPEVGVSITTASTAIWAGASIRGWTVLPVEDESRFSVPRSADSLATPRIQHALDFAMRISRERCRRCRDHE